MNKLLTILCWPIVIWFKPTRRGNAFYDVDPFAEKILVKIHRPRLGHHIKDMTKTGEKLRYDLVKGTYQVGDSDVKFHIGLEKLADLRAAELNASTIAKVVAVGEIAGKGLKRSPKVGDYVIITKYGGEFVPNLDGGVTRYRFLKDKDINGFIALDETEFNDDDDDLLIENYRANTLAGELENQ